MEIILLFLIIGCMVYLCYKKLSKEIEKKKPFPNKVNTQEKEQINQYSQFYQRKLLFTKNEYYEFMKLVSFAKTNQLEVLAKVRLLDLIEPRSEYRRNKKFLYKIQAKHVDFVVTDKKYKIVAIIELDDNSHNRPDRVQRDIFVNEVLRGAGYNVIHTRSITNEVLQGIHYMAYKGATNITGDQSRGDRDRKPELIETLHE